MFVIGLTGSFGTGKSTVASMFAAKGAYIIDADKLTKSLIEPNGKCYKKVAKSFPDAILTNSKLDKAVLAKLVFNNPRELKKLTDILYPEALKQIKLQISKAGKKRIVVLDVPLLFESKWDRLTNLNIVVSASQQTAIKRLQAKLGISKADIKKRLKAQMPIATKKHLADILINNNGTLQETRLQFEKVYERIEKIAIKII